MKIGSKILQFLFIIVMLTAILWPAYVMGQTEKKDLTIRFSPGSYPYNITIGQDNIFYLEIENTGTQGISNIRLYANAPEGWVVEIRPETISYLAVGGVQPFDANIKPAATASKRDYQITFVAEGEGIRRVMTTWVRVENSLSLWLWVGIGIGVIVVAGFIIVFLRLGRQ